MPVLCSNQRNCELMSRATFEQRRNNSGSYCVAFTTTSQHCANVNWHLTYIGPMSDISNVGVTDVGPTLNRCSKMMIRRWPNVNPTVGSTIPRWATLHWPNVECQRWSNITDVIGPTLGQRTLAIWVSLFIWCFTSHATIFQLYIWRHRFADGLKKKLYLRSGSQRHRHVAKFYGRLRLIRSVWRALKFSVFKIDWNCNFCGFITPFLLASAYFGTFWSLLFNFLNYMFGSGSLMRVQYPKCAYGPYR